MIFKKILCLNAVIIAILLNHKPVLSDNYRVISSFSTSISDQTESVKLNISIASSRLNGISIMPGKVFSFNKTVGEGSIKNGFADGMVLYLGETRMEPGGGLCQVSSTLFNAFIMSGVRIVERHRHYQPVTYVPLGLDATIKYGKKDLRVKNPHDQPLIINSHVNDKSLIITISGTKELLCKYMISTEEEEISLPFVRDRENIRMGMAVYVYRNKFINDKIVERFLLYKDFYPPVYIK